MDPLVLGLCWVAAASFASAIIARGRVRSLRHRLFETEQRAAMYRGMWHNRVEEVNALLSANRSAEQLNRVRQAALGDVLKAVKSGEGISGDGLETMLRAAKLLPAKTVREKGVAGVSYTAPNGEA